MGYRSLFLFIFLFITSCSPKSLILDHPNVVSFYFEKKIKSLEKNITPTLDEKRLILKTKVEYAFGVLMEKNDRLIGQDYSKGMDGYKKAYKIFKESKRLGEEIITASHPEFGQWLNGNVDIVLSKSDVFDLYWLAAAFGGTIKSSRGNPFELVYLPRVGLLLKKAILLEPSWGNGTLYSAMMSFTASRIDLSNEALKDSVTFYFEKAISLSDSLDAGPFVTFAESINKPFQNRIQFEKNLNFVLGIDVKKRPEFELSNIIAQKRAKWLLSKTNEFFLE